jgi:hypothetical protein
MFTVNNETVINANFKSGVNKPNKNKDATFLEDILITGKI